MNDDRKKRWAVGLTRTNKIVVDMARARADKLLRDKLFVFGCGHSGNLADAAGEALCITCEIFEVKNWDGQS